MLFRVSCWYGATDGWKWLRHLTHRFVTSLEFLSYSSMGNLMHCFSHLIPQEDSSCSMIDTYRHLMSSHWRTCTKAFVNCIRMSSHLWTSLQWSQPPMNKTSCTEYESMFARTQLHHRLTLTAHCKSQLNSAAAAIVSWQLCWLSELTYFMQPQVILPVGCLYYARIAYVSELSTIQDVSFTCVCVFTWTTKSGHVTQVCGVAVWHVYMRAANRATNASALACVMVSNMNDNGNECYAESFSYKLNRSVLCMTACGWKPYSDSGQARCFKLDTEQMTEVYEQKQEIGREKSENMSSCTISRRPSMELDELKQTLGSAMSQLSKFQVCNFESICAAVYCITRWVFSPLASRYIIFTVTF